MMVDLIAHGYDESVTYRETLKAMGYALITSRLLFRLREHTDVANPAALPHQIETTPERVCRHAEILIYRLHVVHEGSDSIFVPGWVLEVLRYHDQPYSGFVKRLAADETERKAWLMEKAMEKELRNA